MKRALISALVVASCVSLSMAQFGLTPRRRPVKQLIQLTQPKTTGSISLEEALATRRNVTQFSSEELSPEQLSQLAWAGQGIVDADRGLRTVSSQGDTYPIDLYFITADGVFRYRPATHALEQVSAEDVRSTISAGPGPLSMAPLTIVVTGSPGRVAEKFRQNSRTFTVMEAGQAAQNIVLQAVCLDLGSSMIANFDKRAISQTCRLGRGMDPVYLIHVGHAASEEQTNLAQEALSPVTGKRVAVIVPSQGYHDEELFGTMRVLESAGLLITIASSRAGVLRGMGGGVVESRVLLPQVNPNDFDALVFVGGIGTEEYLNNPMALAILRNAERQKKIIAASGTAPAILASAGIMRGVRTTGALEEQGRLQQFGAVFTGAPVERDGYIVTGAGPQAAIQFARAVISAIAGQ